MSKLIPSEIIEKRIFFFPGNEVMIISGLARLYEIELRSLVQAVKRKLAAMESEYGSQFKVVFDTIKLLMKDDAKPKRKIGFISSGLDNVKKKRK